MLLELFYLRFKMSFGLKISSTDSVSIKRMKKLIPKRFKSCFENQKQIFFLKEDKHGVRVIWSSIDDKFFGRKSILSLNVTAGEQMSANISFPPDIKLQKLHSVKSWKFNVDSW